MQLLQVHVARGRGFDELSQGDSSMVFTNLASQETQVSLGNAACQASLPEIQM